MTSTSSSVKPTTFTGAQGDTLAGRLELPPGNPRAYALFAHCFACGKGAVAATRIARALTKHDIAVLRFDFTGLGHSGGDFADTTFSTNVDDLVAAADFLRLRFEAPSLLIGHSLGGSAVLAAAEKIPEVRAIATIGAPADPRHVLGVLEEKVTEIETTGAAWIDLGGTPFQVSQEFLTDIEGQRLGGQISHLAPALLVMHSPTDRIVPIEHAQQIFDAAPHPKSFIALDEANHLLTRPADAEFAAEVIAVWAARYFPKVDSSLPAMVHGGSAESLPEGVVHVGESGYRPYGQVVTTSRHSQLADEPHPIGADSGPSPYEYLLGALGACTSMTLRMYAERKKWPIGRIGVTLRHSRIHAEDCATCEKTTGQVDHIERVISIEGELTSDQRESLLSIADRCPVHRTLEGSVAVTTTLTQEQSAWRPG
ncbi:bifunctional alpha/beta hydrolase/OsmC family protein [Leucobacter sp. Z1108]|uniref:bifunctional alpha/beta hydrolase/OsmC family protein n=1 Tax=unclassified Leucobacter TaxID=2621730 RepID=UPI003D9932D4